MGAAAVMRLQTIVSRQIAMTDGAVVTIGAFQAGSSGNIIPDEAILRLNVRTVDEQVRENVLASIKRIINAEAEASGGPQPPEFKTLNRFPPPTTTSRRHGAWWPPSPNVSAKMR